MMWEDMSCNISGRFLTGMIQVWHHFPSQLLLREFLGRSDVKPLTSSAHDSLTGLTSQAMLQGLLCPTAADPKCEHQSAQRLKRSSMKYGSSTPLVLTSAKRIAS